MRADSARRRPSRFDPGMQPGVQGPAECPPADQNANQLSGPGSPSGRDWSGLGMARTRESLARSTSRRGRIDSSEPADSAGGNFQLGPRPFYLVDNMEAGPLQSSVKSRCRRAGNETVMRRATHSRHGAGVIASVIVTASSAAGTYR